MKQLKKKLDDAEQEKRAIQTELDASKSEAQQQIQQLQQQHASALAERAEEQYKAAQLTQELKAYKLRAQTLLRRKEEELLGALGQETVNELQVCLLNSCIA